MPEQYWNNRLFRPSDEAAVFDLVCAVYPERQHDDLRKYWEWRFFNNTACNASIMLADYKGSPIGIQPVAIFDFQKGTTTYQGAMYTGVLTHPDHRRKGVFRTLVDSANDYANSQGAAFSMTMPNDASYPGFIRTGEWISPGEIPLFLKVIDGRATLKPKLGKLLSYLCGGACRVPFLREPPCSPVDFETNQVKEVSGELDLLFDRFSATNETLMIRRTQRYWKWRYEQRPDSDYRSFEIRKNAALAGVVATGTQERFGIDFGMILDLVSNEDELSVYQLLHAAQEDLKSRGVGIISCQAATKSLQRALVNSGFRKLIPAINPKKFHYVYRPHTNNNLDHNPQSIGDWYLMFGDSDNV